MRPFPLLRLPSALLFALLVGAGAGCGQKEESRTCDCHFDAPADNAQGSPAPDATEGRCLCMTGCESDLECPSVMRCGTRDPGAPEPPPTGPLSVCACATPNTTCEPAGAPPELALVSGFGVEEMRLVRVPESAPALFAWDAPPNARVVSCALFACEPRFEVRNGAGGKEVVDLVNFDACAAAEEQYGAASTAFDPAQARRDLIETARDGRFPRPLTGPITGLAVGCWAYDGDALIAASRLVPLDPEDLLEYPDLVTPGCAIHEDALSCPRPDKKTLSFGTCLDGECLPRCSRWDHCFEAANVETRGAVCADNPFSLSHGMVWTAMGVCVPCQKKEVRESRFSRVQEGSPDEAPFCAETGKSQSELEKADAEFDPWNIVCATGSARGSEVTPTKGSPPKRVRIALGSLPVSAAFLLDARASSVELAKVDVFVLRDTHGYCPPTFLRPLARELGEALGWDWAFAVERIETLGDPANDAFTCEVGHTLVSRLPLGNVIHRVFASGLPPASGRHPAYAGAALGRPSFLEAEIEAAGGRLRLASSNPDATALLSHRRDQATELLGTFGNAAQVVVGGSPPPEVLPTFGQACFAFPGAATQAFSAAVATRGVRATAVDADVSALLSNFLVIVDVDPG